MKIFLPDLNDRLLLTEDWTFTLGTEYNSNLPYKIDIDINEPITIKKGFVLGIGECIDNKPFDTRYLKFTIPHKGNPIDFTFLGEYFVVKLDEVMKMEFDVLPVIEDTVTTALMIKQELNTMLPYPSNDRFMGAIMDDEELKHFKPHYQPKQFIKTAITLVECMECPYTSCTGFEEERKKVLKYLETLNRKYKINNVLADS